MPKIKDSKPIKYDLPPEVRLRVENIRADIKEQTEKLNRLSGLFLPPDKQQEVSFLASNLKRMLSRLDSVVLSMHVASTLKKKNMKIITDSHGKDLLSLEGCGLVLGGVTRERVRQIEIAAIKKLKHPIVGRRLKSYMLLDDGHPEFLY